MTGDDGFDIHTMARAELGVALDWAAAEGWNPGLADGDAFHAADPEGFLVGTLNAQPVSCISVVRYGAAFGFLGFYIVHPDHRGRGFGWRTWQAGMKRLAGRNVGLDGVKAQQDNYRKSGFRYGHGNVRYGGAGLGRARPAGAACDLIDLAHCPFKDLALYDARIFAADRVAFLTRWIAQPGARGLAATDQGALRGYGFIRPCRRGFKVAPLFADDAGTAASLFDALVAVADGAPVSIDVPLPNAAARLLAEARGLAPAFETARMYTEGDPGVALDKVFGITSFELG